ncbi:TonB-dependent receptor [Flagellimonas eckloniae]|uniref:Cobalamin receptor protein n=1 Tax=Flagellimonas eckloniae TaxID=346185 RepID=A0A0Q1DMV7_9FLAO|nr:TonB-dependent receptor [Allomuricauda eckloniae]KQC30352.1 cobalamin receptor protein [Allomuricauda eckloniae]
MATLSFGQQNRLSGTVIDNNKVPLMGVTIQLKPTERYVVTDETGNFEFLKIQSGTYKLIFLSLGFEPYEEVVTVTDNTPVLRDIRLIEKAAVLNEVVVTGKSKAQKLRESTVNVSVMQTEKFLARNTNTSDIIKQIPGVVVRQTGGFGSNAEVYLNGMTGKSVPFFLDGIPLSYYGSGLGLNVLPASLMDQIEVYKGVVPVHLGADALGGGINVITRKSYKNYLDASYSGGSFNSHKINLNGQWVHPEKQWTIGINSFYNHSDNDYKVDIEIPDEFGNPSPATVKRFHDGFSNYLVGLYGGVFDKTYADRLILSVRYSGLEDDIQHNAIMAQPYGEVTYDEATIGTSLEYEKKEILKNTDMKWYGAYNQTLGHFVDTTLNVYTWDGKVFDRRTDGGEISTSRNLLELNSKSLLGRLNITHSPWEKGKFTLNIFSARFRRTGEDPVAAEFYGEDFFANPTVLFKNATGLAYEHDFSKKLTSYSAAKHFWLDAEGYAIQNLEFVPNEQEVSNLGFLQSLRYQLTEEILVKTSYEYATRLPDEFELFGDFTLIRPNPFLEPEQSHNLNFGLQWNRKRMNLDTNFFYRDTDNIIWLRTSQFFAQYQNLLKARTMGVDMEVRLLPFEFLEITANATYQDLRNRSPKSVTGVVDDRYFNARLPNIPYLFGNGELRFIKKGLFGPENILSTWWSGSYVNEFFLFWEIDGNQDFKNTIPSQFVQNIGISCTTLANKATVSLECTNLFDEKVFDNFSVQRPGRAFYITLRTFLN